MGRKLCIILLASFVLAFVIATVSLYIYQTKKISWRSLVYTTNTETFASKKFSSASTPSNICLTPGCVIAAATIHSNIDENEDPCNNFYQFACGGWMKRNPVPKGGGQVTFFGKNQHEVKLQLKELMERKLNGNEPPFVLMLKNMYDSCMDLESIKKANSEPLERDLKMLGGWPVVEGTKWNKSAFNWIEMLKSFRSLGYSQGTLLSLIIEADERNLSNHIISIDQANLGMPDRSYLIHGLNDSATVAYFNLMLKVAKKLGADEATAENELMKSLNFEIALAKISLPREEFRNHSKIYHKFTVRELQQLTPQVPWLKYLNSLLDDEVFEDDPLVVGDLNFVIKVGELISTTDKRVLANYMLWRVVLESLTDLSEEWRNLLHEYAAAVTGVEGQHFRWSKCLSILKSNLGVALSSYYVRNYFEEESREAVSKLYRYIHKEFLENLENIDWMEEETKQEARAKVEAIKSYSGYPDELLNDTLIEEYYSNLTITNDSFYDNILNLKKWAYDSDYGLLREPYVKSDWTLYTDAITTNAYYRTIENSIEFLAGILQKGFFDKNRPHYINFGAIGFVLAHELTHSLDDVGKQYDKDGNNRNWWDKMTEKNFKKKAQCISDQFSNFTAENGMKLNGLITQGENIADNGGFKLAYKAYQSLIKDNGQEQKLPGLKYSPSQLFWISAANIWCANFRPEVLKLRILTGTHTLNNFRIIGAFSNLAEFSHEFNCSSDTRMNPQKKCKIW